MSPINITPISTIYSQKYNTLSQYAQKIVKSQVKSISFIMERFFSDINSELILRNNPKLKEMGIKQVGNDLTEGFVIAGENNDYHVYSSIGELLSFDILKQGSNEVSKHFRINKNGNEYYHSDNFSGSNAEDEITKILDFIDEKLHSAKHECTSQPIFKPFIFNKTQSENFAEYSKVQYRFPKNTDINNSGHISYEEEDLIKSIIEKLFLSQELYKKIPDIKTKYKVRSSYENYMPQTVTNKLGFKNIGPNGESVSLFYTSYKHNAYTAIEVTDIKENKLKFVISMDNGTVRKNLPSKNVKSENSNYRILLTPDYYTQQELDGLNLSYYLSGLNEELERYIEYTKNWFKKKEDLKLIRTNYDTATLDEYKDLLNDIHLSFEEYRTKLRKYLRKTPKRNKFKMENNISTKLASTAVKFDKITSEGYDLRLSYPKIKDNDAMQLLVMQGDEIKNSFYIFNNKLLRISIKDLNDKFNHYNNNLYYYDKKYLRESNLENYLPLISNKLHDLNKKLDAIKEKQQKYDKSKLDTNKYVDLDNY